MFYTFFQGVFARTHTFFQVFLVAKIRISLFYGMDLLHFLGEACVFNICLLRIDSYPFESSKEYESILCLTCFIHYAKPLLDQFSSPCGQGCRYRWLSSGLSRGSWCRRKTADAHLPRLYHCAKHSVRRVLGWSRWQGLSEWWWATTAIPRWVSG